MHSSQNVKCIISTIYNVNIKTIARYLVVFLTVGKPV